MNNKVSTIIKRILCVCMVVILLYGMCGCTAPSKERAEIRTEDSRESEIPQDFSSDIVEKDSDSRTENPEADESIPDSAGEMAGEDDSYVLSEEEKKVFLAYAEYLRKFYEECPFETDEIKFDLVFIDSDNIPELAIIPSDAHAFGVIICVYNDGNVVETGEFGSFGKCRFNPYENLIFSTHMGQGEEESFFYRIEGTESVELLALHRTPQHEGLQYIGESYEVDGTAVSEEVYKQVCEEWDWEELHIWGYDDAVFVNDIDELYRELCKRLSFLKEQERIEQNDSCLEEWKQAYLNYLKKDNYADAWTYSLIYVDDDNIPEMVIDTGFEAGGCRFLTFHDHVLDVWQSDRLNVTYIERENLICNSDGHMGYYYDNVYTIQGGKWVYVDGGIRGDGPEGVQFDENGNYVVFFYWTGEEQEYWVGEEMTEEEYEARLNAIYAMEQSMYPQNDYTLDEIKSMLRTGDWSLQSTGMN